MHANIVIFMNFQMPNNQASAQMLRKSRPIFEARPELYSCVLTFLPLKQTLIPFAFSPSAFHVICVLSLHFRSF